MPHAALCAVDWCEVRGWVWLREGVSEGDASCGHDVACAARCGRVLRAVVVCCTLWSCAVCWASVTSSLAHRMVAPKQTRWRLLPHLVWGDYSWMCSVTGCAQGASFSSLVLSGTVQSVSKAPRQGCMVLLGPPRTTGDAVSNLAGMRICGVEHSGCRVREWRWLESTCGLRGSFKSGTHLIVSVIGLDLKPVFPQQGPALMFPST